MTRTTTWRASSYSGGGDGDNCVEIATFPTHSADLVKAELALHLATSS
ncbi:DUF397 domain-containing protein [Streptomyces pseudogriseolus]